MKDDRRKPVPDLWWLSGPPSRPPAPIAGDPFRAWLVREIASAECAAGRGSEDDEIRAQALRDALARYEEKR